MFNQLSQRAGEAKAKKGDGFFKRLWKKATAWHYENRVARNVNLPLTVDEKSSDGGILLPESQSVLHDNNTGDPEKKYIFNDGREAVYDGDTGQLITDPEYAGTYNYVNPAPLPKGPLDIKGGASFILRGVGHGVLDIAPFCISGNNREGAGPSCF